MFVIKIRYPMLYYYYYYIIIITNVSNISKRVYAYAISPVYRIEWGHMTHLADNFPCSCEQLELAWITSFGTDAHRHVRVVVKHKKCDRRTYDTKPRNEKNVCHKKFF